MPHVHHGADRSDERLPTVINRFEFGCTIGNHAWNIGHGKHEATTVHRINGADNMAISFEWESGFHFGNGLDGHGLLLN